MVRFLSKRTAGSKASAVMNASIKGIDTGKIQNVINARITINNTINKKRFERNFGNLVLLSRPTIFFYYSTEGDRLPVREMNFHRA